MTDQPEPAGSVSIFIDGEGKLDFLQRVTMHEGRITHLAALPHGMASGKASVAVIGKLRDGSYAFLQTSLRLMLNALTVWSAHYGLEADGSPAHGDPAKTRERLISATLIKLIKDRDGSEVTLDIADLNRIMQDETAVLGVDYSADGKSITLRTVRSE